jgi:nicotinamidase-related amidase
MDKQTALVIIDMQVGLFEEAGQPEEQLANIQSLLAHAREAGTPVIYVQHNGPEGDSLVKGLPTWEIHPNIAPREGELVVQKRASDSFYETTLNEALQQKHITHLVVTGGQTEFCVDTTIRRATTLGYNVALVSDAHITSDNEYLSARQAIAYHNYLLDGFGTDKGRISVKPTADIHF